MKKFLLIINLWICPVFANSDLTTVLFSLEEGTESLEKLVNTLQVSFRRQSPDTPLKTLEYVVASFYEALADITQYQVDKEKLARITELQEKITAATQDTTEQISALKLELLSAQGEVEEHKLEILSLIHI